MKVDGHKFLCFCTFDDGMAKGSVKHLREYGQDIEAHGQRVISNPSYANWILCGRRLLTSSWRPTKWLR
jgi:hypothetical protein